MKKVAKRVKKSATKQFAGLRKIIFASTVSTVVSVVALVVVVSGVEYAAYVASGQPQPFTPHKSTAVAELPQANLATPAASSSSSAGNNQNGSKQDSTGNPSSSPKPSSTPAPTVKASPSPTTSTQPNTKPAAPGAPQASTQCSYRAFDTYFLAGTTRTNGSTTITYTVSLTIVPICAAFGNPTINVTITRLIGSSGTSPCINITNSYWGTVEYSRQYNGNGSLAISCVVKVVPPTDISQHYLAPLPSASGFAVNVSATLENGQIVNGGEGKNYYLDSGYDRL